MGFWGIKNIDELIKKHAGFDVAVFGLPENIENKYSQDTDLTEESHRYDFPPKSQEKKTPPDVKFQPDGDFEIQYNDSLSPTTVPTESIENLYNKSNTSYDDLDNEQIDMAHPNKSATINFRDMKTLDELILKHALPQLQYSIYVDLDQVLVDFNGGFARIFGEGTPDEFIETYSKNKFFKKLRGYDHFFRELDWMPDGQELWNYIKPFNPVVLTAPVDDMPYCATDKVDWVTENLGEDVKTIVTPNKFEFASGNAILIDDRDKNIIPWQEAGGIAVKHFSANDSINKLEEIFQEDYLPPEISSIEIEK